MRYELTERERLEACKNVNFARSLRALREVELKQRKRNKDQPTKVVYEREILELKQLIEQLTSIIGLTEEEDNQSHHPRSRSNQTATNPNTPNDHDLSEHSLD